MPTEIKTDDQPRSNSPTASQDIEARANGLKFGGDVNQNIHIADQFLLELKQDPKLMRASNEERKEYFNALALQLEKEGKLGILENLEIASKPDWSGSKHEGAHGRGSSGDYLERQAVEHLAATGQSGFSEDLAKQFLATGLLREFHGNQNIPIRSIYEGGQQLQQRRDVENVLRQWGSLPGGERVTLEQIKEFLKKDQVCRTTLEDVGVKVSGLSDAQRQKLKEQGLLTDEQRKAFETLQKNFDLIPSWNTFGTKQIGLKEIESYAGRVGTSKEDAAIHGQEETTELAFAKSKLDKAGAEKEAKDRPAKEAKDKAEKEARDKAEKEARDKAEKEARDKAEKEARDKAEKEARDKAEKEARDKAEKEARDKAEKEARDKAEKEAQDKAEKEAKDKAEKEAQDKVGKFGAPLISDDDSYRPIYNQALAANKSLVLIYQHGASPEAMKDVIARAKEHFPNALLACVPDDVKGALARDVATNNQYSRDMLGQPLFHVYSPGNGQALYQNTQAETGWSRVASSCSPQNSFGYPSVGCYTTHPSCYGTAQSYYRQPRRGRW